MKSTVKNKVKYGKGALPKDAFEDGQFRMTMWIDLDTLEAIRKQAGKEGAKYQPWLNKKLREIFLGEQVISLESLTKRIEALEQAG